MSARDEVNSLKRDILNIAFLNGEGHIASSFSILDLLYVLYNRIIDIDSNMAKSENRDKVIVSKGHASLGLYVILASKGYITHDELLSFCKFGSTLGGHPDRNKVNGVEVSTGSLGHGFPTSVGIALANKIKKSNAKVYAIVGDGEMNEGSMWEALLLGAHHNLSNLYCMIDYNHSTDRALSLPDLCEKYRSFGWHCISIDGHDHDSIFNALSTKSDKPNVIVCNTIKGYGCKIMENNPEWHHKSPDKEQLDQMIKELDRK